jgi:hypothetical protein
MNMPAFSASEIRPTWGARAEGALAHHLGRHHVAGRMNLVAYAVTGILSAIGLGGCGGSIQELRETEQHPSAMPASGRWTGAYIDSRLGVVRIRSSDKDVKGTWHVTGDWQFVDGSAYGDLSGETEGNVLHLAWKDRAPHPGKVARASQGTGYFVYLVRHPGGQHELRGEWRPEGSTASQQPLQWQAYKRAFAPPAPGDPRTQGVGAKERAEDEAVGVPDCPTCEGDIWYTPDD